jgi:hypothetical protein
MVTICTIRFSVEQFYVLPAKCIYVLCMVLGTNSDYFPIQLQLLLTMLFTARYELVLYDSRKNLYLWAVPWFRRLVASLSPRKPGFDPRPFRVSFNG